MKTLEELEMFMLKHGENIIDTLGAEVDRLEKELKVREDKSKPLIFKATIWEMFLFVKTGLPFGQEAHFEWLTFE